MAGSVSQKERTHAHTYPKSPAQTRGFLIRWASGYDRVVDILTLGQAQRLRAMTIDFRVEVIEALPHPDATFDVVTSSLIIHWIHREEMMKLEILARYPSGGTHNSMLEPRWQAVAERILVWLNERVVVGTSAQAAQPAGVPLL